MNKELWFIHLKPFDTTVSFRWSRIPTEANPVTICRIASRLRTANPCK